jgi:isoquinoline 1-oxidoreductase subunit beta
MAQIAEVEVSRNGTVRVRRVVCAVDCGRPVNPETTKAQIQSAIIFGIMPGTEVLFQRCGLSRPR